MANEFVFRFLSVRPAAAKEKIRRAPTKRPLYSGSSEKTPLIMAIEKVAAENSSAAILRVVTEYIDSSAFVAATDELTFDVSIGLDWAQLHKDLLVTDPTVRTDLETLYGSPLKTLVQSKELTASRDRCADTLYSLTYVSSSNYLNLDKVTAGYKLMLFLQDLATNASFPAGETVGDVLSHTLILPSYTKASKPSTAEPPPPPPVPVVPDPSLPIRTKIASYEQAHGEIADLAMLPDSLTGGVATQSTGSSTATPGSREGTTAPKKDALGLGATAKLVLTTAAVQSITPATIAVLTELKLDPAQLDPFAAVAAIERALTALSAQLATTQVSQELILFGGAQLDKGKLQDALGMVGNNPPQFLSNKCDFQAGVGDLLMVKQNLIAYELGEFAHVENVLIGETRGREHRRLDTSEDISTTTTETDTTKEKDLQSTQRNEMQSEANKTVKSQFGLEAGLQVSGSYGPAVSFASHLNTSFSTSTEEAQKQSVSFSQEITSKTSETISQKITQTVTHRVLQEIQEINTHSFVNSTTKHIRGVYRWLNKVYNAQVFNYGQRMMYELVVPEPAAYFLYAMIENPPKDAQLIKPLPPTFNGKPLKPVQLTRTNYFDYVAQYNVAGVAPPPPEFQNAAFFDKQDEVKDGSIFGRAQKIAIPAGYVAYKASVMSDYTQTEGDKNAALHVIIGNTLFDQTGYWGRNVHHISQRHVELAIAYQAVNVWSFALGVDIYCRLTNEAFIKWQQDTYDAIIATYLKLKADYDEKLAAATLQNDPSNLGQNPLENQRVTKEELKKLVLMMLIGSDHIDRNSYLPTDEPWMDLKAACKNGSWIRFFENAFEWTNILYVLYPYFWGRHARWNAAIHFKDPDSDFAAFLRAGAARVQIPVRPGFEKAVVFFTQTGQIWNGNEPPLKNDDLYVPIVDEIEANLGKFDNDGIPYPDGSKPWEVRVPTDLVLVENIDEIPNIIDVMTGNKVTLL